jgi:acetolactate decarboxylase
MKDYFQKISFNINADIKESERLLKFRHDSFFHAHFISDDREVLGHIDELNLDSSQIKLQVSY